MGGGNRKTPIADIIPYIDEMGALQIVSRARGSEVYTFPTHTENILAENYSFYWYLPKVVSPDGRAIVNGIYNTITSSSSKLHFITQYGDLKKTIDLSTTAISSSTNLALSSTGIAIVSWSELDNSIRYGMYDLDGNVIKGVTPIEGTYTNPCVAISSTKAVIAYLASGSIKYRTGSLDGTFTGEQTITSSNVTSISVAITSDNVTIFTWISNSLVYYKIGDAASVPLTSTNVASSLGIAVSKDEQAIITWISTRTTGTTDVHDIRYAELSNGSFSAQPALATSTFADIIITAIGSSNLGKKYKQFELEPCTFDDNNNYLISWLDIRNSQIFYKRPQSTANAIFPTTRPYYRGSYKINSINGLMTLQVIFEGFTTEIDDRFGSSYFYYSTLNTENVSFVKREYNKGFASTTGD